MKNDDLRLLGKEGGNGDEEQDRNNNDAVKMFFYTGMVHETGIVKIISKGKVTDLFDGNVFLHPGKDF
jgi:hypothetical protein